MERLINNLLDWRKIKRTMSMNPTVGLVNKVLHENKVNHAISNTAKKASSAINKSLRRVMKTLLR